LDCADPTISSAGDDSSALSIFLLERGNLASVARACTYGLIFGFCSLVLPFYREFEHRDREMQNPHTRGRLQMLRTQAHSMALLGAHVLARAIRSLPAIHYTPVHTNIVYAWAEFCLEQPDGDAADFETYVCLPFSPRHLP
jgi:hypothetical protein